MSELLLDNMVTYYHPLNEKIRVFLRVEYLWQEIDYFISQKNNASCLIVLQHLLSLLDIIERFDLRSEAIKYLDRLVEKFFKMRSQPNVDSDKVNEIIQDLGSLSKSLKITVGKTATVLSSNEWLNIIRQKMLLPGGLSGSDSPFLKHWQQFSVNQKIKQILAWREELSLLANAINQILFYIRETSISTEVTAEAGAYQKVIENQFEPQLLIITFPSDYNIYPEISGNRYRIAIRFLQSDLISKAIPYTHLVNFNLAVCW
ncbi:MAG: cell division protein ZapD [Gammaproteobacteria bacterium]|nr:cell division protein ZapD [Gammaproteobacteria bacterium]